MNNPAAARGMKNNMPRGNVSPEFEHAHWLSIRPVTGYLIMIGDMTRGYYAPEIELSSTKLIIMVINGQDIFLFLAEVMLGG